MLTALCLSASHVIARSVHGEIPPIGLSFWRWVTGALILAPLVLPKALRRCEVYREHVPILAVLGFLIVGSTTALFVALNFTTAVNVSLINAIQPVLTVMLAVVFLRDHISRAGMAGIVAATLGALVMLTEGDFSNLFRFRLNGGDLIALAATVGLSLYALNLKRLPADLSMTESLFVISLTGSLMLLPLYVLESVIYMPVPMRTGTVVVVLELALLVSVFGNLMWNLGNRVIGPAHAAMFINLIPLFGAALAITFLGERIFFHHWVGALLICTGIWAIVGGINPKR
ncbi:MAG TPA: DMT family transporter [Woeseiaceae bacterium]|nr:DMT family transporter [Woeseiaceae bacterium]